MIVKMNAAQRRSFLGVDFVLLSHGKESMVTKMLYKKEDNPPSHKHSNEQSGYVISGKYRIFIDNVATEIGPTDSYSIPSDSVAFAKVYTAKIPVTAADTLNDRVLPFFEQQNIPVLRVLTDRGTEYCGSPDKHPYQLYLQLNEIDHTKTKVRSPQTNGICERFHQTILNEFYRVAFRKKIYGDLETLQTDLDEYINHYNNERTHQGKRCQGKTPMQTFVDGKKYYAEKNLNDLVAA